MLHGLDTDSSTLPALQWEFLNRAPVPGPPVVLLDSCNMQPLLPGRTGSLGREEQNMAGRLLQNISVFLPGKGS